MKCKLSARTQPGCRLGCPKMLPRRLEPEVMDTAEEALDYDAMDHTVVNRRFCDDFLAAEPDVSRILDVGTGTGLIPITLCRLRDDAKVLGTDLSKHMLIKAQGNVDAAGLQERVEFALVDAKAPTLAPGSFSAVMSNSIVHHIPEPELALEEMLRVCKEGGLVFVRDLARPETEDALEALVSDTKSRSDLVCAVSIEGEAVDSVEAATIEAALYRMTQELVTNVVRHAQAMTLTVILDVDARQWKLTVQDDGLGFDPKHESISGMGIRGIRERAEILGGHVDVSSQPGAGTTVMVCIPAPAAGILNEGMNDM